MQIASRVPPSQRCTLGTDLIVEQVFLGSCLFPCYKHRLVRTGWLLMGTGLRQSQSFLFLKLIDLGGESNLATLALRIPYVKATMEMV